MADKNLHFMGIGGAGISAVAAFAKNSGFEVSGCDIDQASVFLDELSKIGVKINHGHSAGHLDGTEILVVSPAIESLDPNNEELVSARGKNLPIFTGEEFLAKNLLGNKKIIAVTGTHGKSTTAALVGWLLEKAGLDPNVMVGACVNDWKTNYRVGDGNYFVIEADEYKEKFLLYNPEIAVITAVEMDHPEYFENLSQVQEAFEKFALQVKDYLIIGPGLDFSTKAKKIPFQKKNFNLRLIGEFNQDNASLVFQVGKVLNIDETVIKNALESFNGIGRRFEFKGEEKGVKVFEDYAHHPTAIRLTTQAIRNKFPDNRIWVIYQPHMFSRTKYLFKDFVEVFKSLPADQIILVDIFAARQENTESVTSFDIVSQVRKENVKYIGDFEKTAYYLAERLVVGDVVVFMGAGDIYKLSTLLMHKLKNKN